MQRSLSTFTETQARRYLERLRWPKGVNCPHCRSKRIKAITGGRTGLYQCNACQGQFTVTVGTVMEGSHLPLRTWVLAMQLMNASKKGVSALQLQRMLGLGSYKTAWHLAHRLRKAMAPHADDPLLSGTVEVDETLIGGRLLGRGKEYARAQKTPLVAMVRRQGDMRTQVVPVVSTRVMTRTLEQYVKPCAILMTDEHPSYTKIGRRYRRHLTVKHMAHEFEFRWNHRGLEDRERTEVAFTQGMTRETIALKQLTYTPPNPLDQVTLRRE